MQRYLNALELAQPNLDSPGLHEIARALVEAIEEVETEGLEPVHDPAVLILGAFVAFHTHSDVTSLKGFHRLLELCRSNLLKGAVT